MNDRHKGQDGQVVPFPQGEPAKPDANGYPRMTMISIDSGLDGLTGTFAVDDAGNWIGHDGEVVKYAGEDMDAAVARMRKRAGP